MEPWQLTARQIAADVQAGRMSAREVIDAHLERIAAINGALNAVTVTLADEATAAADEVDRKLRGGADAGPLAGVPVTVKENVDVAGSATTLGIVPLAGALAQRDAAHLAELRQAGAIVIGRTNMPELGMRWHTDNDLRGETRNPWSAEHTPGGSSGGDAAAVAAGMTPIGLGNDGAGSLRWPAQCCGVAALKPSFGRIGNAGSGAPSPFAFELLAVHGPIARNVGDLRLALSRMCGPVAADPWQAPTPLPGLPLPKRVKLLRPGGLHPDVELALRLAATALADGGWEIEEDEPPKLRRAGEIYVQLMTRFGRVQAEQPPVEGLASADFVRFWEMFAPSWERAAGEPAFDPLAERSTIFRHWTAWTRAAPLVLAPIAAQPAFPVGTDLEEGWIETWPESLRTAVVPNLLGLPATAVSTGVGNGLPQAVQIIGPRWREDACLDAAQAIEDRLGSAGAIDPR